MVLQVLDLTVSYSGRKVLEKISFHVEEGKTLGIVGAIGAGKTTLLLTLAGLLPFEGEVKILQKTWQEEEVLRKQVGIVFQNPEDQLFMPTVWEDVTFGLNQMGLLREEVEKQAEKVLRDLEVFHLKDAPPHRLSGGEKKVIAFATVMVMQPKVWLLDEPSANLDPYYRRKIIELVRKLSGTKLIASHDLDLLWDLCDEILILFQGKQVAWGKKELLKKRELLEQYHLELPLRFQSL